MVSAGYKFFELMHDDKEDEKHVANLIVLFAHLYNFKVGASLVVLTAV